MFAICGCGIQETTSHARDRPNVVLISIDSLRADHLGCYGYPRPTSPTIDGLAAEGTLFEVVTSSSSWTLPAHAALFTGLPDSVHGVDRGNRKLRSEMRTLAEALHAAGYRTAGVWSCPLLDPRFGFGQGFDVYVSHLGSGGADGLQNEMPWDERDSQSHQIVTGPSTLERVDELLDSQATEPFFLFVHLWDVHYDYIPPAPYDTLFDPDYSGDVDGRDLTKYLKFGLKDLSARDLNHLIALYDGEIAWTDQQVSHILHRLDAAGVAGNTVVVVTSDHGEELFDHGSFGHKRKLFDESIRIPLVVRFPGHVPAGMRIPDPAQIVDIAPTILELADAEPLPEISGRSLLPRLAGVSPTGSNLAVSELVTNPDTNDSLLAVRSADWKIIVERGSGKTRGLWNLAIDPQEKKNVFGIDRDLTSTAVTSLESALDNLENLKQRRHTSPEPPHQDLADDLRHQLEILGYVDDGSSPASDSPIKASPNPIRICSNSTVGATVISWELPDAGFPLEIRVDAPDGKLFAMTSGVGSAATGNWVHDGMVFFLVRGDTGEVVGRTIVRTTREGCLQQ